MSQNANFATFPSGLQNGEDNGIVRWIKGTSVLLTAYEESYYFSRKFREILQRHFDVIPMKFSELTGPRMERTKVLLLNLFKNEKSTKVA